MAYIDMWAIIDDSGIIHSGTEDEMQNAFWYIVHKNDGVKEIARELEITEEEVEESIKEWCVGYRGDLKLIQIHEITR